jgi:hypothetical protein
VRQPLQPLRGKLMQSWTKSQKNSLIKYSNSYDDNNRDSNRN